MRKGPHPLPLHLGIALAHREPEHPYDLPFRHALSEGDLVAMMRGIKMYHAHPCKPSRQKLYLLWNSGVTRLLETRKKIAADAKKTHPPLILIPSLINGPSILDLCKERSLMRWLESQGVRCYLLDWGDFVKNGQQNIDIEKLIEEQLLPAIRYVSEKAQGPVDCLGYCMGGTLLATAQDRLKDHVRRCVFLAAPWDFHAPGMVLTDHVASWSPSALPVIRQRGHLPSSWLQGLFATLDADGSARKFIRFAEMDQDSEAAHLFVLVEDWLNEGVDLPAVLAQECIQKWFIRNETHKAGGKMIAASKALIVASTRDKLVPYQSAIALQGDKLDTLKLDCGHIGFIAGKHSIEKVWTPICNWLCGT